MVKGKFSVSMAKSLIILNKINMKINANIFKIKSFHKNPKS